MAVEVAWFEPCTDSTILNGEVFVRAGRNSDVLSDVGVINLCLTE